MFWVMRWVSALKERCDRPLASRYTFCAFLYQSFFIWNKVWVDCSPTNIGINSQPLSLSLSGHFD